MIALDRQVYKQAKEGTLSIDQLVDYLLKNYPVYEIALSLAETIQYEPVKPIAISREEFEAHFRIRGVKSDGTEENRGRPRSVKSDSLL